MTPAEDAARSPHGPGRAEALILMYHRVAPASTSDPWLLAVTPDHFAEHMAVLRRHASPTRLRDIDAGARDISDARHRVAVTFDDGYADNLHAALPELERHDIPATIFVVSHAVGLSRAFWWDELERLLLEPGTLPKALAISIDRQAVKWNLGDAATYSAADARRCGTWRTSEEPPTSRHALYLALWRRLQPLGDREQRATIDALRTWAAVEPEASPSRRTLTRDELARLARHPLIEAGAHTATHPLLPAQPVEVQRAEIEESRACVEALAGVRVASFSYPYGAATADTTALVEQAGFARACSTCAARLTPGTSRFQLPRMAVEDWDGDEFSRRLAAWLA